MIDDRWLLILYTTLAAAFLQASERCPEEQTPRHRADARTRDRRIPVVVVTAIPIVVVAVSVAVVGLLVDDRWRSLLDDHRRGTLVDNDLRLLLDKHLRLRLLEDNRRLLVDDLHLGLHGGGSHGLIVRHFVPFDVRQKRTLSLVE